MYAKTLLDSHLAASTFLGEPIIFDSFAGGGGASEGIKQALGRSPDIAINHNPAALALHEANHPETLHISENVYRVDPLDYLRRRHVGLAWFSPDCKHFSKAKGGKPVERNIRDLAWIIPGWIERIQKSGGRVDVVIMENVEEFSTWGPLVETDKGMMPDPEHKGATFKLWCDKLRALGGRIEKRELRACDYGAPTIRKRLFLIIRFDKKPIVWPAPTHGAPDDPDVIAGRKLPWRTAAEIIDWSIPCPSIFDTREQIFEKFGLRAVRPLAVNSMARIARGTKRHAVDEEDPFLVNLTHGARCEDIRTPLNTVTCANRGEKAVVMPHVASYYGHPGERAERVNPVDEPLRVIPTENRHAIVSPHLMTMRNSGKPFNGADEPTHTITAGGAGLSLVAPSLVSMKGSDRRDGSVEQPHPTVCAGGGHSAVVAPILTYAQQGGGVRSVEDPVHTITASDKDQNQIIVPTLVGCGGRAAQSRPRSADEPTATITAKADSCIAAAFLAQHNGDPRRDGSEAARPGRSADEPLATVTATGTQQQAVAAFLAQNNYLEPGHDMRTPVSTIVGKGSTQGVVAPFLSAYYGVDQDTPENEPFHTLTTKPRFSHVETLLALPPFTPDMEERAREVAAFLRSHGCWDDREFVTLEIAGITVVMVDIGMRMLTPRELYNAQGFPTDYEIERGPKGEVFSKSVQVSCVGNSVSPPVAKALVGANCSQLVRQLEAAE